MEEALLVGKLLLGMTWLSQVVLCYYSSHTLLGDGSGGVAAYAEKKGGREDGNTPFDFGLGGVTLVLYCTLVRHGCYTLVALGWSSVTVLLY